MTLNPGDLIACGTNHEGRVVRIIWSAQLAVLFLLGGVALLRLLSTASPPVSGPWATTDHRLQRLELPHPSEAIRSALDGVRAGALLFVGREDEPTTILTYYTVSYLLWPRPVGLCLSGADIAITRPIVWTEGVPVAVMYYDVEPPTAGVRPIRLGRHLAVVALSELGPWTTRCR